jgi:hypothetical protein
MYDIHHCLFAIVFFNPLIIFPNHIKFIIASADGTTKTKKYPKVCIWMTCGTNEITSHHNKKFQSRETSKTGDSNRKCPKKQKTKKKIDSQL